MIKIYTIEIYDCLKCPHFDEDEYRYECRCSVKDKILGLNLYYIYEKKYQYYKKQLEEYKQSQSTFFPMTEPIKPEWEIPIPDWCPLPN